MLEMKHEDCLFCKIVNGEITAANVYEDDYVLAFLNISPVCKGHTLVILITHAPDTYDTPAEVCQELFARIPKISQAIKVAYTPAGMNVLVNNEAPGGHTVCHLHIH